MKEDKNKRIKKPSFIEVIILLVLFLAIAFSFTAVFDLSIQLALFIALFLVIILGLKVGYKYDELQEAIKGGISSGLDAVLILITVGALIGTWIAGGIVPSIIYYGLEFIHPSIFLLATVILCAVTSLATGTSWGTAGTAGVAMVGVGGALGIPLPLVVGAVLSGAYFGDKLSPLSDSTVLASSMSKVDVIEHVKSLLYVSVPALVISGLAFTIVGFTYATDTVDLDRVESTMAAISSTFNISWYMLIPAVVVIVLLAMKKPAIPTIAFGALLGVIWAGVFQGTEWVSALSTVYEGFTIQSGNEFMDELLNRGGITSMLGSIVVIILGLAFGGLLNYIGALQVLVDSFKSLITNVGRLSVATVGTGLLSNIFGCSMYVSLIMTPKVMEKNYDDLNVDRRVLSRNTEVGGTLTSGMVPWTDNGIFMAAMFGVPTLQYLPYMWMNFAAIILVIIYGYTKKFIWYQEEANDGSEIMTKSQ
ncbi:Na+/H+ antiporter NhaC [Virgibacillus sp. NKC19-16]|uniref:Na+/H+ antiporter NhaC n=1 Tax=Virgibacillus salidurans TaxID=2831673 RepID=UPI001F3A6528|nr:Na+/H+ antiporter NhaC [Virgibacillus sp. NKC19-16]UJL45691.1 Na+/H+ antiporter NhaC [Virgibacillus sp. NKC19-16]